MPRHAAPVPLAAAVALVAGALLTPGCEPEDDSLPLPGPQDDAGTDDGGPGRDDGGGQGAGRCVQPGEPGNERGVGRSCEPGGDACTDNGPAQFCSADFWADDTVWGCTFPCNDDDECGAGAACTTAAGDPEGTAVCVPDRCVEGPVG